MKRKTFIYLSVVGTAAVAIPSLKCHNQNEAFYKSLSQPKLLSHICDEKTLRAIGAAYKNQFSSERKKDQLADLILTDGTGKPLQSADAAFINSVVDQKIKQDFENGKTVVVMGWVLSVTEARQCALFSLA